MMRQGDEIYFHAGGEPTSGKVVCHGKHGATVKDAAGQHHRVKYENVLGHKSKSTPAMSVVDQGVDGAIVADEGGKKSYVHGLQPGDEPEDAPVQPKGFEMLGKALVLFAKSGPIKNRPGLHLEKRTDKLGHQSGHWVKGQEADPAPREAAQPDPEDQRGSKHGYGTHNIEPGDRVNFDVGGQAGDGEITAAGKDGATVKTDTGDQKVFWHEIRGHQAKKKEAGGEAEKKQPVVLGKQEPIPADDFSAAGYAKSHDLADVTPESILAGFPEDTAGKIAAAQDRLKSIEQTIDQFKHDGHWDAKREALHAKILFDGAMVKNEKGKDEWEPGLFSAEKVKSATPVPGEKPKFIILGGRGGSGKSSFKNSVYDPAKFIVLDADKIKSMMPEYEGWNAAQVHEESGEIFDNVARMARERGLNVVLDKTMKTAKSAVADVQAFKDAGYHTEAHYMHLPRQEAAKRAVQRFIDGGANGRYVPISVVLSNTSNEGSFDDVRKLVDAWSFRDNNVAKGDKPVLISEGSDGAGAIIAKEDPMKKSLERAILFTWTKR